MALWTPTDITTTLWLDASDSSTITESSGSVSQWDDKSGNDYHFVQTTSSKQPTILTEDINSLDVLDFDRNSYQEMTLSNGFQPYNNDAIIISVVNLTHPSSVYDHTIIYGEESGSGRFGLKIRNWTPDELIFQFNSSWPSVNKTTVSLGQQILSGYRNGSTVGAGINAVYNTEADGGDLGASTLDSWTLGNSSINNSYMEGSIAEVIVVLDYDSDTLEKLEGYLAHKWGLEGSLPAGHPYKSSAPTTDTSTPISSTDNLSVSITESISVDKEIFVTDDLTVSITDELGINASLEITDTLNISIEESFSTAISYSQADDLSVSITEALTLEASLDVVDTLEISMDEVLAIEASCSSSDDLSISLTENMSLATTDSIDDTLTVGITQVNSVEIADESKSSDDNLGVSITESLGLTTAMSVSDNLSISLTDDISVDKVIFVTDDLSISISDSISVNVAEDVADNLSISITQTNSVSILGESINISDNLGVLISESVELETSMTASDNLSISLIENISVDKNIDISDDLSISITDVVSLGTSDSSVAVSDTLSLFISEVISVETLPSQTSTAINVVRIRRQVAKAISKVPTNISLQRYATRSDGMGGYVKAELPTLVVTTDGLLDNSKHNFISPIIIDSGRIIREKTITLIVVFDESFTIIKDDFFSVNGVTYKVNNAKNILNLNIYWECDLEVVS